MEGKMGRILSATGEAREVAEDKRISASGLGPLQEFQKAAMLTQPPTHISDVGPSPDTYGDQGSGFLPEILRSHSGSSSGAQLTQLLPLTSDAYFLPVWLPGCPGYDVIRKHTYKCVTPPPLDVCW